MLGEDVITKVVFSPLIKLRNKLVNIKYLPNLIGNLLQLLKIYNRFIGILCRVEPWFTIGFNVLRKAENNSKMTHRRETLHIEKRIKKTSSFCRILLKKIGESRMSKFQFESHMGQHLQFLLRILDCPSFQLAEFQKS